jgi:hypothetical protein
MPGSIVIARILINGVKYTDFSSPLTYDGEADPHIIGEIEEGPTRWGMCIKYTPSTGPGATTEGFPGPDNPDVQREWNPYTIRQNGQQIVAHDDETNDEFPVNINLQKAIKDEDLEKKLKGKKVYILLPGGNDPIPNLGVMGAVGLFSPKLSRLEKEHMVGTMIPVKKDPKTGKYVKDKTRKTLVGKLSLVPATGEPVGWSHLFKGVKIGHYYIHVTAGPGVNDSKLIEMIEL